MEYNLNVIDLKTDLNKPKLSRYTRLVCSRTSLQRKGFWLEKIIFRAVNWEYLCKVQSNRSKLPNPNEFDNLAARPAVLFRSRDIRDKNDINHIKTIAALINLSSPQFAYLNDNFENLKFQFFVPSISKHKTHRKFGGADSSIYVAKKSFLTDFSYFQFFGFFIGYLIPEMQKKHMTFSYKFCYLNNNTDVLATFWHLTDLPQLLTSSLFPSSLHDYYDWSNSSMSFITNILVSFDDDLTDEEQEGGTGQEIEITNNSMLNDFNLIWNYFKIF